MADPTPRSLIRLVSRLDKDAPAEATAAAATPMPPPSGARGGSAVRRSARRRGAAAAAPGDDTPRTLIRRVTSQAKDGPREEPGRRGASGAAPENPTPRTLIGLVSKEITSRTPKGEQSFSGSYVQASPGSIPGSVASSANSSFASVAESAPTTRTILASAASAADQQPVQLKRKRTPRAAPLTGITPAVVKSLFASFSTRKTSQAAHKEIQKGVSLFLDQVSDDLSSYAHHAGRATIERADVELLLSRQRLTTGPSAPGLDDLIRRFLPMEYVEALIPVARAHNKVVPEPPHHGKRTRRSRK